MSDSILPERVTNYLVRHIAWLKETLRDLERLEEDLAAEAYDAVAEREARRASQSAHLAREHRGLLREWQAAGDIPPEAREAVRKLAQEAELLTARLRARYLEGAPRVQREMFTHQEALNALRRGRDMLGKYRPGDLGNAGLIDKKA